jgi:hypothetical protein
MKMRLLFFMLVPFASRVEAQEWTINLTFDNLPVNTVLSEQFAPLGVHFVNDNGDRYPWVIAAPSFPNRPGSRVAYSFEDPRYTGMRFDYPIASVSMDVAVDPAGGPNGSPAVDLIALDQYPPSTVVWVHHTPLAAFDTWTRVTLDVPAGLTARLLEIQPDNVYQNLNYNSAHYFDNIQITYVPEPSSVRFASIGVIAFICRWLFKRQRI